MSRTPFLLLLAMALPSAALAQTGGPDASGNVYGSIPFDFVPLVSGALGSELQPGSDGQVDVTLPFAFPWYGASPGTASVSANGGLRLNPGGLLDPVNEAIPSGGANIADIAVFWDDLNPSAAGQVRAWDDSANGRFIISWEEVEHVASGEGVSFQVHLRPNGSARMYWADTSTGASAYDDGASATIGIQDALGGTVSSGNALQFSYDTASVSAGMGLYFGPCGGDIDGDGAASNACGGTDCDDLDPTIYPGAPEVCDDGLDQDCDGVDIAGDQDGDGDPVPACGGGDCDDLDANAYIGAPEFVCDGVDQACDGIGNEADDDGDGVPVCGGDCDDSDPSVFVGAPEACGDGVDQDCDGSVDELADGAYELADDGSITLPICSFSFPFCGGSFDSFTLHGNGRLTFGDAGGLGFDDGSGADATSSGSVSDLHGDAPQLAILWSDLDPSLLGSVSVLEDASTSSVTVSFVGVTQSPGWSPALLGPNTVSLTFGGAGLASWQFGALSAHTAIVGWSCGSGTGSVDLSELDPPQGVARLGQGTETSLYQSFSASTPVDLASSTLPMCLTAGSDDDGDGWTDTCGDCDDTNASVFPGAAELCDGVDHDCSGAANDQDADGDGYLSVACGGADCDDGDADTNPEATEICDGLDNDCDGNPEVGGADNDGDGWLVCGGDCDDGAASINPEGIELCNEEDDNCDGFIDEGWSQDADADGTVSEECGGNDCDDTDATVAPNAEEICDGKDNDCDSTVDEVDVDADGYIDVNCNGDDCNDFRAGTYPGAPELCDGNDNDCNGVENDVDFDSDGDTDANCGGTDCDDRDASVNSGAAEICDDSIDNDCDGGFDGGTRDVAGDDECSGCAASVGASEAAGAGLWMALVLVAVRRRRAQA